MAVEHVALLKFVALKLYIGKSGCNTAVCIDSAKVLYNDSYTKLSPLMLVFRSALSCCTTAVLRKVYLLVALCEAGYVRMD